MEEIFIAYAGLLSLATVTIYAGAWGSLPSQRKAPGTPADGEDDEDDEQDLDERLSSSDAYLFPVLASGALLGLYLVFKYLGTEWVNWLLGWYFAIMGVGSVWKTSVSLARTVLGRDTWKSFENIRFFIVKNKRELFNLSFRAPTMLLFPLAFLPSVIYQISNETSKPALMTNILALSFAFNALCLLKLDSFKTGTILLGGLFVYDIWWVFGTEVMVKVATTLDAPIKILWPKSSDFSSSKGFTMLGLGDIVIPGAFVTLALRRDLFTSQDRNPHARFAKPYFTAALVSYILGLVCTMTVMHTFKAAQPALLYLSPACILSFLVTSLLRGELREAWQWKDEPEPKPDKDEDMKVREPTAEKDAQNASAEDVVAPTPEADSEQGVADDEEDESENKSKKKKYSKKKR